MFDLYYEIHKSEFKNKDEFRKYIESRIEIGSIMKHKAIDDAKHQWSIFEELKKLYLKPASLNE